MSIELRDGMGFGSSETVFVFDLKRLEDSNLSKGGNSYLVGLKKHPPDEELFEIDLPTPIYSKIFGNNRNRVAAQKMALICVHTDVLCLGVRLWTKRRSALAMVTKKNVVTGSIYKDELNKYPKLLGAICISQPVLAGLEIEVGQHELRISAVKPTLGEILSLKTPQPDLNVQLGLFYASGITATILFVLGLFSEALRWPDYLRHAIFRLH